MRVLKIVAVAAALAATSGATAQLAPTTAAGGRQALVPAPRAFVTTNDWTSDVTVAWSNGAAQLAARTLPPRASDIRPFVSNLPVVETITYAGVNQTQTHMAIAPWQCVISSAGHGSTLTIDITGRNTCVVK